MWLCVGTEVLHPKDVSSFKTVPQLLSPQLTLQRSEHLWRNRRGSSQWILHQLWATNGSIFVGIPVQTSCECGQFFPSIQKNATPIFLHKTNFCSPFPQPEKRFIISKQLYHNLPVYRPPHLTCLSLQLQVIAIKIAFWDKTIYHFLLEKTKQSLLWMHVDALLLLIVPYPIVLLVILVIVKSPHHDFSTHTIIHDHPSSYSPLHTFYPILPHFEGSVPPDIPLISHTFW